MNKSLNLLSYRLAKLGEEELIFSFAKQFSSQGELLPLTISFIKNNLFNFTLVFTKKNELVGLCLLYYYDAWLAEIRSLAVKKEWQGKKVGSTLIKNSLVLAKKLLTEKSKLKKKSTIKIFTLTRKLNLFTRLGFKEVNKNTLPEKIYQDCRGCPSYPNCLEKSLVIYVGAGVG